MISEIFCFICNQRLFLSDSLLLLMYYACCFFFLILTKSLKKRMGSSTIVKKKKITDASRNEENPKLTAFLQGLTVLIRISNYLEALWQAMLFS